MRIYAPRRPRPARLPVLEARARRDRRRRAAGARLPAHARPARARDPRRRLAALRRAGPRRDRARVREGGARGCSRDGPRRRRRRRPRRPGEHLPYLAAPARPLHARRARRAEPRPCARRSAQRYGIAGLHADYRALLDAGELDALVVCSPAGTHAEVVLAALDAGLHVFVEKPMCITLADADAIVAARDRAGQVVQVGTMKRYDPASSACSRSCRTRPSRSATSASSSTTRSSSRTSARARSCAARDVPRELIEATRRAEAEQVRGGRRLRRRRTWSAPSPRASSAACSTTSTSCTGCSSGWASRCPREVVGGRLVERGARGLRRRCGSRTARAWDSAWIQLLDTFEYRESISFFFADSVRTLAFPSPWLKQHPTVYRRSAGRDGARTRHRSSSPTRSAFARELTHFHACIVGRRAVPDAARAGAPRHRRADADVPRSRRVMRAAIVGTGFIARVHATRCALRRRGRRRVRAARGRAPSSSRRSSALPRTTTSRTLLERERSTSCTSARRTRCTPSRRWLRSSADPRRLREAARQSRPTRAGACSPPPSERPGRQRPATTCAATRSSSRCAPTSRPARSASSRSCTGATSATTCSLRRRLAPRPGRSGPSYVVGDLGTHWLDLAEHVTGQHVIEVLAEFRSFAGRPARGLRAPAAPLRRTAPRVRSCSRPARPGRKNQLLFECEGSSGGFTWDQEAPTELLAPPAEQPTQIVVKDPAANAGRAAARALPGRPRRGLRRCLPEPLRATSTARSPASRTTRFPTFADGHRGVPILEAALSQRRGRRLGLGGALGRGRSAARHEMQRAAHESRQHERERDQEQRRREQQRGERVHLGRDPELHLRVDVDRQRVVAADQEQRDDELVEREREGEQRAGEDGRQRSAAGRRSAAG